MEANVDFCLKGFNRKFEKGKHLFICVRKPNVDQLYKNLEIFDKKFETMCETSKEYRGDF